MGHTLATRTLSWFAWTALAAYGGLFAAIAVLHILYPGFTETMEGDVLQHIRRVTEGRSAYPMPGGEFIALCYMPLYYFVAAPFYLLLGDGFAGPRLLSSLSALASGGLVGLLAARESGSRGLGALAAALFFAGYRVMDAYLTCALPDTLMLLWILLGLWFLAHGTRPLHDVLWLLFFTLAFWTKQHGAFYLGFAVLYALLFRKNGLPRWALVLGLVVGGPVSYLLLGRLLGDGFFYHTFVVPGRWEHRLSWSVKRTVFVLACFVPFASVLSSFYLRAAVRFRPIRVSPLAWFTLTSLATSVITMTAAGSSNNHYIPFLAALAATSALGVKALLDSGEPRRFWVWLAGAAAVSALVMLAAFKTNDGHALPLFEPLAGLAVLGGHGLLRRFPPPEALRGLVAPGVLVLGQLAASAYFPPHYLPDPGYSRAMARLQDELSRIEGPVFWLPYGSVPPALSGKAIGRAPSWVALEDLERQQGPPQEAERRLQAFLDRFRTMGPFHLLTEGRIDQMPVWRRLRDELVMERDFGREFSAVAKVTPHWYGWRSFPTHLYRSRF